MLFHSAGFLLFFPVVVLIYFIIPRKIRNLWLLLASYYFYMCWNAKYALLLLTSTVITYVSGILLHRAEGRLALKKWIVAGSFVLNIGILFYYKYINFLLGLLGDLARTLHIELQVPVFDILLPVGISFYIFQALSYTMDVYRGDIYAEKNFFRYALFVSFFPQLVAGPIERSKNLLKQLAEPKSFDYERVREGLLLMLWGYFLKLVIADRCAVLVNTVYGDYTSYHGFQLVLANVLFAVQIYGDFMGYSVIAKGAAKVLGYELMENFSQPYFAVSIREFWRRWHISLSSWLRDYLYIPLGGSRGTKGKKYRNLMITFLVSGLWHGANLTFVFWGALHGLYQIAEELLTPVCSRWIQRLRIRTETFSFRCLQCLKTFFLVDLAWIFFRADTLSSAAVILKESFNWSNTGLLLNGGVYELGLDERNLSILALALIALAIHSVMKELRWNVQERLSRQNAVFRYALYWSAVLLITFSLDISGQEFIYFQF
ncbi:MAG: MBOAT family protein [Lachnospiraceae bacterium]|jgi:alginate O-acetyltransferase complex protein AlgI|nr:MBOAT family protein [Lachnospiraceae bacterium]